MSVKRIAGLFLVLAVLLCGGFLAGAVPVSGGTAAETVILPTLFHNDEAWYKDGAAPLVVRDGVYFVPAELFGLFEGIRVTTPSEGNLLIFRADDERYISIRTGEGRAAVNGTVIGDVQVFRDGTVIYVDAALVAETVGLKTETILQENGRISMRVTDGTELLTTEQLEASYYPEEPADEFAGLEEKEKLDLKRIFILCREPAADAEYRVPDLLQKYEMGYTLFLSADTSAESLLSALAGGEYGILTDASGEEAVTELNAINERFGRITHYRTHFTMTPGTSASDEKLIAAAYCPVSPDFVVDSSVDAGVVFADMLQYLEENNYCFLLLEDCWQTQQMLEKMLIQIDREKYITSNLGH